MTKTSASKGKLLDDARRARRENRGECQERRRERGAVHASRRWLNQEVEVPMALTKCQLGVEQSAIKAFAFSLEKQNPFFPRFE